LIFIKLDIIVALMLRIKKNEILNITG